MPPAASSENVFLGGMAAMLINADFNAKTRIHPAAQQRGYQYSATLMRKGPGGTGRRGGMWIPDAIQLSSASANADEAWALAKWLTDRDTGLALALQTTGSTTPGARPDVYNDPRFLNHAVFPQALQQLDRDANQLPEIFQLPANFKISEFEAVLGGAVDRIWRREAEPTASLMKALNDDLQRVLDLPR